MGEYALRNDVPIAKKVENLYLGRVRQFTDPGGDYRDLNLAAFYDRARTNSEDYVKLEVYSVPDLQRPLFRKAIDEAEWRPAHIGDEFGPSWSTHWFRVQVRLPEDWHEKFSDEVPPLFNFDSSDEGFVYLEDGTPVVGLSAEHNRAEWTLPRQFLNDSNWHTFYIETSCNNISGTGSPPDPNRRFRLNRADLVVPRSAARALNYDFWIIGDAARELPESAWQRKKALNVLNKIMNRFDRDDVDASVAACREIAKTYLGPDIDSAQVFAQSRFSTGEQKRHTLETDAGVWALGNCHIDTAWLWPYAETRRKIARSWASQLDLLERYPEYVFVASQAVQFQWLKEDHPDLFERVRKAVKDGRFVPVGGSWVECDTNMPSGESLARQMILGQQFFEREFGVRSKCFWLPDSFGYAPQLPQVCRQAGQPFFLTQKLSWSQINSFPHSTFNWVGLDGSQVLCHMPPDNTYTAQAHFGDIRRSLEQHKNLDIDQHGLMLFGHGDGGGGPISEHLEKIRRCRGLSDTVGTLLPRVHYANNVNEFYEKILAGTNNGAELPTWEGELYLEYHRGTYTTQAKIKHYNRLCESLMFNVEVVATAASLEASDYTYPHAEIRRLWEDVCLNQFHDVLPGSGIGMIYEDALEIYSDVVKRARELIDSAVKALGHKPKHTGARHGLRLVAYANDAPATVEACSAQTNTKSGVTTMENKAFRVTLSPTGLITSMFDKTLEREVLAGPSNKLLLFEDQPLSFPAWDTDQFATEKWVELEAHKVEVEESSVHLFYTHGTNGTKIHQTLVLEDDNLLVQCDTDWHETYQFLKAEFTVDVRSPVASYDAAFGVHQRPTHYNTSWDVAKFEVCGHKFADLSGHDFGVALISGDKYGYSVHGNRMHLSLLRSPKSPDANADMGRQSTTYRLAPHSGPLGPQTVRLAGALAESPIGVSSLKHKVKPLVKLTGQSSIVVSAVKRAFKDESDDKAKRIIVRVYESLGGHARDELVVRFPIKRAKKVTFLEDIIEDGDVDVVSRVDSEAICLDLKPFEVQTLLIELE